MPGKKEFARRAWFCTVCAMTLTTAIGCDPSGGTSMPSDAASADASSPDAAPPEPEADPDAAPIPALDAASAEAGMDGSEPPEVDAGNPADAAQADASEDAAAMDAGHSDASTETDAAQPPHDASELTDATEVDDSGAPIDAGADAEGEPSPAPIEDDVECNIHRLDVDVTSAAYCASLDRIVLTAAHPSELLILDPQTLDLERVALPMIPFNVSIAEGGSIAAVQHNGFVSIVDLESAQLLATWSVAGAGTTVLATNGFLHAFSSSGGVRSYEVATGIDRTEAPYPYAPNQVLDLSVHREGGLIYATQRHGSSNPTIYRYDPDDGVLTYRGASPYSYPHPLCSPLHASADHERLFTGCATVLRTGLYTSDDWDYVGSLPPAVPSTSPTLFQSIAHNALRDDVYAVQRGSLSAGLQTRVTPEERYVGVYTYADLEREMSKLIPCFATSHEEVSSHGRFVFPSADGEDIYVIAVANPEGGLLNNWGFARISPEPEDIDSGPFDPPAPEESQDAECSAQIIDADIRAAAYSSSVERIAIASAGPPELVILDPETLEDTRVALPAAPTDLSMSPDGARVLIGHEDSVSAVDLASGTLLSTVDVHHAFVDLVLTDDGIAYVFPDRDALTETIDVVAGLNLTPEPNALGLGGLNAVLHPSGDVIYTTTGRSSPRDISALGLASYLTGYWSSPYHGHHRIGDLYPSKDGRRLFTMVGTVFRASPGTGNDMAYNGSLEAAFPNPSGVYYRAIEHDALNDKVYVIQRGAAAFDAREQVVGVLSYDGLELEASRSVPCIPGSGGAEIAAYGRFVFSAANGDGMYVLAQAAPEEGLERDWALAVMR